MARVRILLSLIAVLALSTSAWAQTSVALAGRTVRGTISANGGAVTLTLNPGQSMGSAMFQSLDSYSGTIEAQCSLDGITWDAGNEPLLQLLGGTTTASSVTDTTGIWSINGVAGCRAIRIIATAGFAATDTTIIISILPSGAPPPGAAGGGAGTSDTLEATQIEVRDNLAQIEGFTDGLEALIGTTNTNTAVIATVFGSASLVLGTQADNVANTADGLQTTALNYVFDGTTWDRWTGIVSLDTTQAGDLSNIQANTAPLLNGGIIHEAIEELGTALNSGRLDINLATVGGVAPSAEFAPDLDSGGGTRLTGALGLAVAASGGPVAVTGDATNGLDVDVTRLSALVAGTASIGEVTGVNDLPIIACNNVGVIDTATSGNVQLVALSGGTTIYVCSYTITAEATVDFRFVRGTGTACATGEASISGTYALSTTTGVLGISRGSGLGMITKGTAGDAFCIELGGAVQVNGEYTYAQF
jgi:hypothetical protein